MRRVTRLLCSVLLFTVLPLAAQTAQDTAFTYQGELRQNNAPVTASVDMIFTLYDAATSGNVIGTPIAMTAANSDPVQIVDGLFTVRLDFNAPAFLTMVDDARWLAVTVNGNPLSPRTKIENSPYALTSQLAYGVLAGSIGATQINATQVQQRVSGTCAAGSSVSVINVDGSVSCQTVGSGTITGVAPVSGSGLTGGGTSGSVTIGTDTAVLQKRVSGTCAAGSAVSAVNVDGTVSCQSAGTGTVTSIAAGSGLTGGTITSSGTLAIDTSVVALASGTWSTGGNAGIGSGFLGTTDGSALLFKVNGVQAGQIQPTNPGSGLSDSPNVIFGSSVNTVAAGLFGVTVGGGGARGSTGNFTNSVSGIFGTISGGSSNTAGGGAFVGGGNANSANGTYSTIGGGQLNVAGGFAAVVPGGQVNKAGGFASMAAGSYAHVRSAADTGGTADDGTFIWSDSTGASANQFTSSGNNQFLVRAGGGVGINTTPYIPDVELTIRGSATAPSANADIVMLPRSSNYGFNLSVSGTGQSDAVFAIEATSGFTNYLSIDAPGNVTVNQGNLTLTGSTAQAYKPGGGAWAAPSDARLKRDIQPLDHMLDKLLRLRGVTFEYAHPDNELHPAGRHTGFIAQEVQPVFPEWVGKTPDGYLSVGPQGFEAMTVEALRELRAEKDAEIADLKSRLDALSERVERLQAQEQQP